MNIQEIANEHSREIIKNIFSKLDDEEAFVILELNNQLQDKISKIDKAIEYNKEVLTWTTNEPITDEIAYKNLEILGDKENE